MDKCYTSVVVVIIIIRTAGLSKRHCLQDKNLGNRGEESEVGKEKRLAQHPYLRPSGTEGTRWSEKMENSHRTRGQRHRHLPSLLLWRSPSLEAPPVPTYFQETYSASFLKPMARRFVGVPLVPFQTWVFQGSGWEERTMVTAVSESGSSWERLGTPWVLVAAQLCPTLSP